MRKAAALALLICLVATAPAVWAQSSGTVYGVVSDESGAVLPGATVTLSGVTGTRSTVSGAQGEYRVLNIDPGSYTLSAGMTGFVTMTRNVTVNLGSNLALDFGMKVRQIEETVTVTGEAPVVDTKRVGTSTTLTKEELSQVPQSRDPWAVLKSVPGVIVDRVSIAGNEAGQQSMFVGKGASNLDTTYSVDGVTVTDSSCGGCSPSYYDFDAFEEIKVDTGGNDLKVATGGVGINFVTKRGTNNFHGSVHSFFSHDKLQSGNVPDALRGDPRLQGSDKAQHIDQINDYGADIGGPIIKDKLWFWGSYGKNDIRLRRFNQTQDKTLLPNWNAKVNWQASQNDMVSFFFFNGAKEKFGRSLGFAGNEPDGILVDQGNFYAEEGCGLPCGLHGLFKVEDNHIFSPNFFVNVKYAFYNWGYGFSPRGGMDESPGVDTNTDTAYGSLLQFTSLRPWHVANIDTNLFKNANGGTHEFKFGFGYRRNPTTSTTTYAGTGVIARDSGGGVGYALVTRPRLADFISQDFNAYVGDTFTKGRVTVNAGVRWGRETAKNRDSSVPGNPLFPEQVPGISIDSSNLVGIKWNNFSPRVAATMALDDNRKTVARVSYARYAGALNAIDVFSENAAGAYYPYLAYNWVDLNGDHQAQRNEVLVDDGVAYSNVIDPANPTGNSTPDRIDPDYKANIDHEFIVGVDRELMPNLALNVAYTWRRSNRITAWNPRNGLVSDNYSANERVTLQALERTFVAQTFTPDGNLVAANPGRIVTNRPDYHRGYNGFELSLIKRLSNKWMARAAFSYMDWKEHFDGPASVQNPTSTEPRDGTHGGPLIDGGPVALRSYGDKGDVYFNSKWQFNASALYQLPAGFEVAGNVYGRQGNPFVAIMRLPTGNDGNLRALATPALDTIRLDNLWTFDLRAAKNMRLGPTVTLGLTLDVFNVFNRSTVLQRTRQVNALDDQDNQIVSNAFFQPLELLNPRIARIGVRLGF